MAQTEKKEIFFFFELFFSFGRAQKAEHQRQSKKERKTIRKKQFKKAGNLLVLPVVVS
jgi:hypothetical protein